MLFRSDGVEDPILKLKITKSLVSNIISNQEVIELIQEQIELLEEASEEEASMAETGGSDNDFDLDLGGSVDLDFGGDSFANDFESGLNSDTDFADDFNAGSDTDTLPSPSDLGGGLDFTGEI